MQSYIAQNCLTYSKRADQWLKCHPEYYEDFKGTDFCCALGANIKGFHNSHSLPTYLENELAARLHKIMPFAEKFKFLKTGSDACSAAVRIARAYKERRYNEKMQQMSKDKTFIRVSQRPFQKIWSRWYMQDLCIHLSGRPQNSGDKKKSTVEILQNLQRQRNRKETFSQKKSEDGKIGKKRNSPKGEILPEEETMYGMWGRDCAWTPPRLQEASRGDMALPIAPLSATFIGVGLGYHGTNNTFIASENPGAGCVDEGYLKLDNFDDLLFYLKECPEIAYCIIEPVELNTDVKPQLKEIRRLCNEKNIVLIFDEVITFGRVPYFSVANYLEVKPDIIVGAKSLGNGYPISFVGGRSDIMETPGYFISGTFFGCVDGLNAAIETLDFLTEEKLEQFWHRGAKFQRCLNILHKDVRLYGYPTRAVWKGEKHLEFIQEMWKRGYLLHPKCWFLNFDHTEEILNQFINDAREVCKTLDTVKLYGERPKPIFQR